MKRQLSSTWWSEDCKTPHRVLTGLYHSQRIAQSVHYNALDIYVESYEHGAAALEGFTHGSQSGERSSDGRMFANPAANAVDTLVSQVCGPKIIPMCTTARGNFDERDRAERLNEAVNGLWRELDIETRKIDAVRDAALNSVGVCQVFTNDEGRVATRRIDPRDILVDESEGHTATPRCIYIRHFVDVGVAMATYAEDPDDDSVYGTVEDRAAAIDEAPAAHREGASAQDSNTILLIEAWHLPSGPKAKDGRYAIVTEAGTLVWRSWGRKRFPLATYRPKRARSGWWGIPLMRTLLGQQREFEKLTGKIQLAHHRLGGAHILSPKGAEIETRQLSNAIGDVIEYAEGHGKPEEWTPSPVAGDTYQYKDRIAQDMLAHNGISNYAAKSEMPQAVMTSGKSQLVFQDSESRRHIEDHRELEHWSMEIVDCILDEIEELKADGGYMTRALSRNGYSEVDAAQLVEDREKFELTFDNIGMISQQPAAKFAQLDQMFNNGLMDKNTYRRLTGIPDLDAENDLDTSDERIIDKSLNYIVKTGEYISPEPLDDLGLALKRGGKFYNLLRCETRYRVPEDRLELVREWLADVKALIAQATPPQSPPAPNPAGMPAVDPNTPPPGGLPNDPNVNTGVPAV